MPHEEAIGFPPAMKAPFLRLRKMASARLVIHVGVAALFTLLYFWVFTNTAQVLLVIETPEPSLFRLYWADRAGQYRQTREAHLRTKAGEGVYRVDLADLSGIRMLRLDPSERRTRMTIRKMVITQQGFEPLSWEKGTDWEGLTVLQQIEGLGTDGGALSFEMVGGDAQLALPVAPRRRPLSGEEWSRFLLLLALLLLALHLQDRWGGELRAVPAALALAMGLALCMAMLTPPDRHPDEWAHLAAGQYYEDRWLPPKICSPETRHTFSVYGASRLLSKEIVYLLAGKFSYLIGHLPIPLEIHQRLRLFNVLILAGLLGMTLRHAPYRFLCLPLLISPQIWYIFSYFNSEAFALGVTLLWARQVFDPHSALHRLWDAPARAGFWNVLGLGGLFGLALLIKKNFHIVGLFLLIETLRHFIGLNGVERRRMVAGSALLLVVGMGLLGIKLAGDWSVNGFRQRQAILRCREQMAAPAYRSDTPLAAQYPLLHLRQRGVAWREILDRHRWGEKCFRSAFGVYGYTSISASPDYYRIVKTLVVLLGGYLAVLALRRPPPGYRATLAAALACALALTAALFWHAWTGDMQAQGRYFLPAFIFMGALLYRSRTFPDRTIPNILTVGLFLLSVYSFVLLGLVKTSMAG